jgi:hypothetical protein
MVESGVGFTNSVDDPFFEGRKIVGIIGNLELGFGGVELRIDGLRLDGRSLRNRRG